MTKTKKAIASVTLAALLAFGGTAFMSGCSCNDHTPPANTPDLDTTKIADFGEGGSSRFTAADKWSNGSPFDVHWSSANIAFTDGTMNLSITERPGTVGENEGHYLAGEYRSQEFFGYGDYSVRMKPLKQDGVVSTFFTYTDEKEDNPHDEIDIEFLGKETTKVQFNYYGANKGGHEKMYDLGFDASEAFHEYGFRWSEDSIIWFVDGTPVYMAVGDIPTAPGRIMMNSWCGDASAEGWTGKFTGPQEGAVARYEWVGCSADPVPPSPPEPVEPGKEQELSFTTASSTKYAIDPAKGTTVNVTYDGVTADWSNVVASIGAYAADTTHFKMKAKNNGAADSNLRIDVIDAGGAILNTGATADGVAVNTADGSYFMLTPGKEITIDVTFEGKAQTLILFLDSFTDGGPFAGNWTFGEFSFA